MMELMPESKMFTPEMIQTVIQAGIDARNESLAMGLPVFYRDTKTDFDMMELPDGRKFQIRLIPGKPRGQNYEVIREITADAA